MPDAWSLRQSCPPDVVSQNERTEYVRPTVTDHVGGHVHVYPPRNVRSKRVGPCLTEIDQVDRVVYAAVAGTQTPSLDNGLRRLSNAANHSRLWFGIAAGLALVGRA